MTPSQSKIKMSTLSKSSEGSLSLRTLAFRVVVVVVEEEKAKCRRAAKAVRGDEKADEREASKHAARMERGNFMVACWCTSSSSLSHSLCLGRPSSSFLPEIVPTSVADVCEGWDRLRLKLLALVTLITRSTWSVRSKQATMTSRESSMLLWSCHGMEITRHLGAFSHLSVQQDFDEDATQPSATPRTCLCVSRRLCMLCLTRYALLPKIGHVTRTPSYRP